VRQLRYGRWGQEATRLDYLHEVEHMERGEAFWRSDYGGGEAASPQVAAVVRGLQGYAGLRSSAVTSCPSGQIARLSGTAG